MRFTNGCSSNFSLQRSCWITTTKGTRFIPPEHEFLATLKSGGVDFESLRDPWDVPYRVAYSTQPRDSVITIYSNGPDKVPNTADDIEVTKFSWSYFNPIANKIRQATIDYFERTSNYIRDYPTLRDEIEGKDVDLDTLQDPWGHPYQFKFDIAGPSYVINVVSGGPDGVITGDNCHDILESSSYIHYFQRENAALVRALAEHYAKTGDLSEERRGIEACLGSLRPDEGTIARSLGSSISVQIRSTLTVWRPNGHRFICRISESASSTNAGHTRDPAGCLHQRAGRGSAAATVSL